MSEYVKCPICKEYGWLNTHKCKPRFIVFADEDGILYDIENNYDPKIIYANDEEEAVIKYCESDFETLDSLEIWAIDEKDFYSLIYDNPYKNSEDALKAVLEHSKKFQIESEVVRNFYANEISK
jgi:hypothetical protein